MYHLIEFSQQLCEVDGIATIFAHEAQRRKGELHVRESMDLNSEHRV